MKKNKLIVGLLGTGLLAGLGMGAAGFASAQSLAATTAQPASSLTNVEHPNIGPHIDGNITAINGTTITLAEETAEGGTVYTVDASGAKFMKDGAAATISAFNVGDKIFVDGTATGTNVVATQVDNGRFGGGMGRGHGVVGTVSAVNGTTLTVSARARRNSDATATVDYTVDAANAKVLKASAGAAPAMISVSGINVGDRVMIRGPVTGTSIAATNILDGQPHRYMPMMGALSAQ